MKVLLVSFLLDPRLGGGAATSAIRLARGLAQQGVEVVTVTSHNEPEPRLTIKDDIKAYAFRPRNLYWVINKDRQPLWKKAIWQSVDTWNLSTYRYLRRVIDAERPDVIHIHKLRGLSPSVWSAAAAENCRPIIQTCRDYELISPEGTLSTRIGQLALQQHWSMRPYQALRRSISNQVDVATAPSRFTLETITGVGFFSRAQKFVVPNTHGLTASELNAIAVRPLQQSRAMGGLKLLYLGRLEPEKGIELLCRAFTELSDELPDLTLDIAGSGTQEAAIRASYTDVPRLSFHGHIAGKEKEYLIAQADALVMPSTYQEIFGNSIIETYAYGKPVIASRIGGMPELVEEGITGLLVDPNNMESLQKAIRQLYATPEAAAFMRAACLRQAESYTIEAITDTYLSVYEAGMSARPNSPPRRSPTTR